MTSRLRWNEPRTRTRIPSTHPIRACTITSCVDIWGLGFGLARVPIDQAMDQCCKRYPKRGVTERFGGALAYRAVLGIFQLWSMTHFTSIGEPNSLQYWLSWCKDYRHRLVWPFRGSPASTLSYPLLWWLVCIWTDCGDKLSVKQRLELGFFVCLANFPLSCLENSKIRLSISWIRHIHKDSSYDSLELLYLWLRVIPWCGMDWCFNFHDISLLEVDLFFSYVSAISPLLESWMRYRSFSILHLM